MPGTNLTREEARERAALLDATSYDVSLDLTLGETHFASTTVLRFTCSEPGAGTFVDLVGATHLDVRLNGETVDASAYADSRIALEGLAAENELTIVARMPYSHTGEGLHRFVDPVDDRVYLYTQFEVPDARRVFATFEQPDLKSVYTFHVTAPASWVVTSNSPTPEPEPAEDGAATWHFAPTKRLSTYVTAVVAGEYDVVSDSYRGTYGEIPLSLLVRRSLREHLDADEVFALTRQGFAFFEDVFAMGYPFGKYDQAFVPEYNMGAMENAGLVVIRDEYVFRSRQTRSAYEVRANTILHEMAHMWFGDLVTMRWWDDLWLNESFAEWAASHATAQATKYTDAWTAFANARKMWAYRQDQLSSTHPIAADNHDLRAVEANFDGITYAKGASTLKQLVAWVGEKDFVQGLRAYFDKHAYGNTDLTDLLSELESASGRDLSSWAEEWLRTSGVNTMRPVFEVDDDGRFASFAVQQEAAEAFPTLRRHRVAIGLYDRTAEGLVRRDRVEVDVTGARSDVAELLGRRRPDLVLLNDDDLTYAKIRLDERSLATVTESIADLPDSLARALCWGAAWDMTRDAEMTARDYVRLVLAGVAVESDLTAVGALLAQARTAIWVYAAPEHRDELARQWETGLRALLDGAAPGSDHQLAFARAYAGAVRSDEAVAWLRDLLAGRVELEGLALDADLRWSLLTGLAKTGAADDADIDAELERDQTISGRENAAAARAVQPTAEAKAAAWGAVFGDGEPLPNETERSVCTAFQVSGQAEVLKPYVARFLDEAGTVVARKGTWRASVVLLNMFPRANPDAETLAQVDAWLERGEGDAGARRYLAEGRDDLVRALAAQRFDASR